MKVSDYSGKVLTEDEMKLRKDELVLEVLNDPKLRTFRTDSEFLLRFLHCTEFNIPLALIKIRNYHDCFLEHPDWFTSKPPLEFKEQLEFKDKTVLNEYDRKGRSILIIKVGKIRTEVSSPPQETQIIELWVEYLAEDYKTQSNGISVILDMKDYSWKLFRWLSPTNIRIAVRKIDTYPLKEVVIHVVNTSFLLNASLKLIWPFMNERIKRMVFEL
ncbi:hypothetical protein FQR65_LT04275 [Abscondita terminalis]|nr:hypothetical protein FQR65_LT04275 [Abscondita terminalis]